MYRKITILLCCLLVFSYPVTQAYHVDKTFRTLSGNDVPLSSYEGKPMILEAIQIYCGACKNSGYRYNISYLHSLFSGDVIFLTLTINDGDTINEVKNFVSQFSIAYTVGIDNNDILTTMYSVSVTPTTILLNTDGTMARKWEGHPPIENYVNAINKLVENEKTIDDEYTGGDGGGNSGPSIIETIFSSPIFQFSFVGLLILVIYFKSTASGTKIDV